LFCSFCTEKKELLSTIVKNFLKIKHFHTPYSVVIAIGSYTKLLFMTTELCIIGFSTEQFCTIFFWTGAHSMTLQELYETLLPSFPKKSVHKDVKTAVHILAKALQCPDPEHCSLEQFNRPLPSLYQLIETSLIAQGKSAHTIRNTK